MQERKTPNIYNPTTQERKAPPVRPNVRTLQDYNAQGIVPAHSAQTVSTAEDFARATGTLGQERKTLWNRWQDLSLGAVKNSNNLYNLGVAKASSGLYSAGGAVAQLPFQAFYHVNNFVTNRKEGATQKIHRAIGHFNEDKADDFLNQMQERIATDRQVNESVRKTGFKLGSGIANIGREFGDEMYMDKVEIKGTTFEEWNQMPREFKMSDLADTRFWSYDVYGSLIENAPQMYATIKSGQIIGKLGNIPTATPLGRIADFLTKTGGASSFGISLNAGIESENVYNQVLQETGDEAEAFLQASRTWDRNVAGNSLFQTLQTALIFSPSLGAGAGSTLLGTGSKYGVKNIVTQAGKYGLAGLLEVFQERMEESISSQSDQEEWDIRATLAEMADPTVNKSDVVAFILGIAFQGAGDVMVRSERIENTFEDMVDQTAETLGIEGETREQRQEQLLQAIETDPDGVQQAWNEVQRLEAELVEQARQQEVRMLQERDALVQDMADLLLQGTDPQTAMEMLIVDGSTPVNTEQTARDILERAEVIVAEQRSEIDAVLDAVRQPQEPTQEQQTITREMEQDQAEVNRIREENEAREKAKAELAKNNEISAISKLAEQSEVSALQELENLIRNEIANISPVERAVLASDVLDTIQTNDLEMMRIIASMPISQVIQATRQAGTLYQTDPNVTGRAKFKNLDKEDIKKVGKYLKAIEALTTAKNFRKDKLQVSDVIERDTLQKRGEELLTKNLKTDIKRIAKRYGLDPDNLTDAQLAYALRRLLKQNPDVQARLDKMLEDGFISKELEAKQRDKKYTPPLESVEQLRKLPLFKHVDVRFVESILTPEGKKAFGSVMGNIVKIARGHHITTIPHEHFHVFTQLALNKNEQQRLYDVARKEFNLDDASNLEVEEVLAQRFAVWYVNRTETRTLTDKVINFFKKIADYITNFAKPDNLKVIEGIFEYSIDESKVTPRIKSALERGIHREHFINVKREYYDNPAEFTLRFFNNPIFNKPTMSYQEAMQAIKAMNLKAGENTLHFKILELPQFKNQKKIDTIDYKNVITNELLKVNVVKADSYADFGFENLNTETRDEKTYILNTDFSHGKAGHFGLENVRGLHSHFRAGFSDSDFGAFKVVEIQSDFFQKDNTLAIKNKESIVSLRKMYVESVIEDGIEGVYFIEAQQILLESGIEYSTDGTVSEIRKNVVDTINKNKDLLLSDNLLPFEQDQLNKQEQFMSMKNNWYSLTIKEAIRQGAVNGSNYVDFADTMTVAKVEGFLGDGSTDTYSQVETFDGSRVDEVGIGEKVTYLGDIDAYVIGNYGDSIDIAYASTQNETTRIEYVGDIVSEQRYLYEINFAEMAEFQIENDLEVYLTNSYVDGEVYYEQLKTLAIERQVDVENTAELWGIAQEQIDLRTELGKRLDDFKEYTIDNYIEDFDAITYLEDIEYSVITTEDENMLIVSNGGLEITQLYRTAEDVQDLELEQRLIVEKYGEVTEESGKTRVGAFLKEIRKQRPDVTLYEDGAGNRWWRTEIQDSDLQAVELFQTVDGIAQQQKFASINQKTESKTIVPFNDAQVQISNQILEKIKSDFNTDNDAQIFNYVQSILENKSTEFYRQSEDMRTFEYGNIVAVDPNNNQAVVLRLDINMFQPSIARKYSVENLYNISDLEAERGQYIDKIPVKNIDEVPIAYRLYERSMKGYETDSPQIKLAFKDFIKDNVVENITETSNDISVIVNDDRLNSAFVDQIVRYADLMGKELIITNNKPDTFLGYQLEMHGFNRAEDSVSVRKPSNLFKDFTREALRRGYREIGAELHVENMTARERFDISKLEKISFGGSDRDVYRIPNTNNVVKIAKTARGLAQNLAGDYLMADWGLTPELIERGRNYVVYEAVDPPNQETVQMVREMKEIGQPISTSADFYDKQQRLAEVMEKYGYDGYNMLNYEVLWGDILAIRNWGSKNGKPILVDEGSLDGRFVKEFAEKAITGFTNMQDPEFRQIYEISKQTKKQYADTDVRTMYQTEDSIHNAEESTIYKHLANRLDEVVNEVATLIELSQVHTSFDDTGRITNRASSYPNWIPKELRNRETLTKALNHFVDNTTPPENATRITEAYNVIAEHIIDRLPDELAQAYAIEQIFAQDFENDSTSRAEARKLIETLVKRLDKQMKQDATGLIATKKIKKTIRTNLGEIRPDTRAFAREMKKYYRTYNRGYKVGYKQGSRDKLAQMIAKKRQTETRRGRIDNLKRIYKKMRQATRTGSILPIEYQLRLKDIFDAFDLTTMTDKTKQSLEATRKYFESIEGDVPADIAQKLTRLEKIPVGKLSDDAIQQIVNEVSRIFENGVVKKKLIDERNKKEYEQLVQNLTENSVNLDEVPNWSTRFDKFYGNKDFTKINLAIYDPMRIADMLDGGKDYNGENVKLVNNIREAIDAFEVQKNLILEEAIGKIRDLGVVSLSQESKARMTYRSALDQGGESQAQKLRETYSDFDFDTPLTETESSILQIMRETFKDIRPQVQATYELITNKPMADIEFYLPFKYDRDIEIFDVDTEVFDFTATKTADGFTMTRLNDVSRVLNIEIMEVFTSSISQQLYYAHVQPPLGTLKSLVNAKPYANKIGKTAHTAMLDVIKAVATRGNTATQQTGVLVPVSKFANLIRNNTNLAFLGYKLSTILVQPSANFDGMVIIQRELGSKYTAQVLPKFFNMLFNRNAVEIAREQSNTLASRQGGNLEIQELQRAGRGVFHEHRYRRWYSNFKKHAFDGILYTDMATASNIFTILRDGYMKEHGMSFEDATRRAEITMQLSQSSSNIMARPLFLNSPLAKVMMPFSQFLTNAFNHMRYDTIHRNMKEGGGGVRGALKATHGMAFIAIAVAYETFLYKEFLRSLFGYEEDEEQTFWDSFKGTAIGRVPASGWLFSFDGEIDPERINVPLVQAGKVILREMKKAGGDNFTERSAYLVLKNAMAIMGIAGTQQIHQVLTAPDLAFTGLSIGNALNISWDSRTNTEKRHDAVKKLDLSQEVTPELLERLAKDIYGRNYTEGTIAYRNSKQAEVSREIAIRREFGFDDEFVNANLNKRRNNDVKHVFSMAVTMGLENPTAFLSQYTQPATINGEQFTLMSSTLEREMRNIARASADDMVRIMQITDADVEESDVIQIIAGDTEFARRAYQDYRIINKDLFEVLTEGL